MQRNSWKMVLVCGACLGLASAGCRLTPDQEEALCEAGRGVVCDGLDVVLVDLCEGSNTKLEECEHACHLGECVDCAPQAGLVCFEDHVWSENSCGVREEKVEDCVHGCAQGGCTDPSCTPGAGLVCVGNNVYEVDTCGNPGEFAQLCPQGCQDGACLDCSPFSSYVCYDGDIYSLDSCELLGPIQEDCASGTICQLDAGSVSCVAGTSCTPNAYYSCFGADLHYVNSCGNVQPEIYEACDNGCDIYGCLDCLPVPVGYTCLGNNRHYLVGGCDEPSAPGQFIETCDNACQLGECVATQCVPNAGAVCDGDDLYAMDSCQVRGDFIETCANGCSDGRCEISCEPAGVACGTSDDHLHAIDTCGTLGDIVTRCVLTDAQPNCDAGVCLHGQCTPHALKSCGTDGNVYWMDSCWNQEELFEDCAAQSKVCHGGDGEAWCDTGSSCTPGASTGCNTDGNVWSYDSCGTAESLTQQCGAGEVCQASGGSATCVTSSGPDYTCYCETDCALVDAANDFALVAYCDELLMYPDPPITDTSSTAYLCVEHCGPSAYTCGDGYLVYDVAGAGMTIGACTGCGTSCTPGSPPAGCFDCAMCETFCAP